MWKMRWWTPLSMGGPCCLIDSQDSIGIWPRLAFSYALSTQDFQSTVICNFWVVLGVKIGEFDSTISSWPKSMLVLWWQWFRIGSPAPPGPISYLASDDLQHPPLWFHIIFMDNVPCIGASNAIITITSIGPQSTFQWMRCKSDKRSKRACAIISPTQFKFLVKKFLL